MSAPGLDRLLEELHLAVDRRFELCHPLPLDWIVRRQHDQSIDNPGDASPNQVVRLEVRWVLRQQVAAHCCFGVVEGSARSLSGFDNQVSVEHPIAGIDEAQDHCIGNHVQAAQNSTAIPRPHWTFLSIGQPVGAYLRKITIAGS